MEHEVKVYSTPTCPHCLRTKQYLDENKIIYQNIDVTKDRQSLEEMLKKTGQLSVPVIEVDGQLTVGFDKAWVDEKLGLVNKEGS